METNDEYIETVAYTATRLTEAHHGKKKARELASIIDEFTGFTGHSKMSVDSVREMRKVIKSRNKADEWAWSHKELYKKLGKAVRIGPSASKSSRSTSTASGPTRADWMRSQYVLNIVERHREIGQRHRDR